MRGRDKIRDYEDCVWFVSCVSFIVEKEVCATFDDSIKVFEKYLRLA